MAIAIEKKVKTNVRTYKTDIDLLEHYVKKWEQEFRLRDLGKTADQCYDAFCALQANISKVQDIASRDKTQMDCYRTTRDFICFFEELNTDLAVLVVNHCPPFTRLIDRISEYCAKIEKDYKIELESEKEIRSNPDLIRRLKSLRGE